MNWAVATALLVGCVLAGVLGGRVVGQRPGRLVLQAALVATALVLFAPWLCVSTVAAGALLPLGYPEPPAVPDVCWTVLGLRLPPLSAVDRGCCRLRIGDCRRRQCGRGQRYCAASPVGEDRPWGGGAPGRPGTPATLSGAVGGSWQGRYRDGPGDHRRPGSADRAGCARIRRPRPGRPGDAPAPAAGARPGPVAAAGFGVGGGPSALRTGVQSGRRLRSRPAGRGGLVVNEAPAPVAGRILGARSSPDPGARLAAAALANAGPTRAGLASAHPSPAAQPRARARRAGRGHRTRPEHRRSTGTSPAHRPARPHRAMVGPQ